MSALQTHHFVLYGRLSAAKIQKRIVTATLLATKFTLNCNIPRRGPVPKFSDLEVVALSLTAETESIDSEKWLFDYKLQEYKANIPNLISRRQFNDRRKKTAGLCEELCKRIAMKMDGGEEQFFIDSKPIEVCRVARGKRCKMYHSAICKLYQQ